jgi:DNA-binding response OmpR family regulator
VSEQPARPAEGAPRRALVAEDDGDMRALVVLALEQEGFAVDDVADGRRLWIHTLSPGVYDLVVTDMRLPVVDGLTVVEDLRAREIRSPLIVMTAFSDESVRRRAARIGAVVLDKPFSMDELCAAARRLCQPATQRGTP